MPTNPPSFELMLPKGMRDLDPEDALLENHVLDTLRTVFELYGYSPLETPVVERMEILKAKFAAGEGTDVSREIFVVEDQGGRDLGLRFDMTVPLARYVAMHPTVKIPFKRYAIGKVYRDGPIKLGRYREFWQADADIVGVPGTLADSEGVLMAADAFERLGLKVNISLNSREVLKELMESLEISSELRMKAIIALDKLKKIGEADVIKEMKAGGIEIKKAKELLELTKSSGGNEEKMARLERRLKNSHAIKTLRDILSHLSGVPNLSFDPSLARGLAYYTGFFFECTLQESKITSSLVGTGRYDTMIGQFSGGKQEFAGVGISFGVSVICDALKEKGVEMKKSVTKAYVVPVTENERSYALSIARNLRKAGINTDMDLLSRSIGKNAAYADAQGIPWLLIVGEEEVKGKTVTLKNMKDGSQQKVKMAEVCHFLATFFPQNGHK